MFSLFEDMDTPQNTVYLYVFSELIVSASGPNFEILTHESNCYSLRSVPLDTKVVISQSLNVIQI